MINNMTRIISSCILLLLSVITTTVAATPSDTAEAKVNFKIIDESDNPIDSANVAVGFVVLLADWSSKSISQNGYSNSAGHFTATAKAGDNLGFTVKKEGYYNTYGQFKFKEIKNDRWEPWNSEIRVVLRKIGHRVPMYARDTQESVLKIPVIDKEVGFDLIKFDWTPPYGNGVQEDLICKLEGTFKRYDDYDMTLTVSFLGKFDGVQTVKENLSYGSRLKLMRNAPSQGYMKKIVKYVRWNSKKAAEHSFEEDNNYIFRIRSEEKDGKLIKAMYGKIQGEIKFYPKSPESASIVFKYYLNPDYTQNLEWSGENLFVNLNSVERNGL